MKEAWRLVAKRNHAGSPGRHGDKRRLVPGGPPGHRGLDKLDRRLRYDLDHIDPYVPPDDGGPPGQTSTANLARLCRFHHRVKTHGDWTYRRTGPTELIWTSPLGKTYTVDEHGTLPRH